MDIRGQRANSCVCVDLKKPVIASLTISSNDNKLELGKLKEVLTTKKWKSLNDIDGFFWSACYVENRKAFLLCDPLGIYPLYYCTHNSKLFAAPSMAELLDIIPFEPTPSIEGALSFLLFGHHVADETVFKEIRRCEGGEVLEYSNDTAEISRQKWRKPHIYDKGSVEDGIEDRLADAFVRGVESAVKGQEKIIIPLSGGFDSRAVLGAALASMEAKRICAVTFGGKDTLDFQIGRMVARKAGVKSIAFPITVKIFDEGFQRQRASAYAYGYSAFATQPLEMINYIVQEELEGYPSVWGAGGDAITGSHLHPSDLDLKPGENLEDYARLIDKRASIPLGDVASLLGLDEREAIHIIAGLLERSSLDRYEKPWQFLDAWDIFVRGRMELISVLPFSVQLWRCPHFSREYFDLMATQGFDEKIHQSSYKRMLTSRYKSLFSLPTKRLGGRPLVSSRGQDLYWTIRWQSGKGNKVFRRWAGRRGDGVGRNYGRDQSFLDSIEGRKRLRCSIDILMQQGIVRQDLDGMFDIAKRSVQLARMLITLGYAFGE